MNAGLAVSISLLAITVVSLAIFLIVTFVPRPPDQSRQSKNKPISG